MWGGRLLRLGLKSLVYNFRRTYSAVVGVALCVALIVTTMSVAGGFYISSSRLAGILTTSPYLLVLNGSSSSLADSRLTREAVEALEHPNVEVCCPQLYLLADASLGEGNSLPVTVRGAELGVLAGMKGFYLNLSHPEAGEGAFVGVVAADWLGLEEGENLTLIRGEESLTLTCVQVFASNTTHDLEILLDLGLARLLAPEYGEDFSLAELKLREAAEAEETAAALEQAVPGIRVVPERAMMWYVELTAQQLLAVLWGLGAVIATVMAVGVYYAMQNTVEQSVYEIAVLRALGVSRRSITLLVLFQSLLIGVSAGVLGAAMGVVLADVITVLVTYMLAGTYIAPFHNPINLAAAVVAAAISGVVGGVLPARRAANIPPGVILR